MDDESLVQIGFYIVGLVGQKKSSAGRSDGLNRSTCRQGQGSDKT